MQSITTDRLLATWCHIALLVFCAGFYFLGSSKQLNNVFYISLCLPGTIIFLRNIKTFSPLPNFYKLFFLLVLWMILATIPHIEDAILFLKALKPFLYLFLLSIIIFFASQKTYLNTTLPLIILFTAAISGGVLIYDFYELRSWNFLARLKGVGAIYNPIGLGAIYGTAALIAIIYSLDQKKPLQQLLAIFASIIPFLAMLLTQSRGPIVAFFVALTYALYLFRNRLSLMLAIIFIGFSITVYLNIPDLVTHRGFRIFSGDSYRMGIWQNALNAIWNSPVWGHGLLAETQNFIENRSFAHFHNVYLTLLFNAGLLAIIPFSLLVALPFFFNQKTSYQEKINARWKPLLVFGCIYMLFDGSLLFTNPKELWLIFWIPLFMLWSEKKTL